MSAPAYRLNSPPHPGAFVREIIDELGLTITAAATALSVTRPAVSALVNQRAALSSDMALRIEKAFGVRMDTLMRMQNTFDIAEARKREEEIDVKPFVSKPPQARIAG